MAEGQKISMIEGMTEEAARKYLKFREMLDNKLIKMGNLGKTIYYASESGVKDIELSALGDVGDVINEMVSDLLCKLDEYISYSNTYLKIAEIDHPEDQEKLNLNRNNS